MDFMEDDLIEFEQKPYTFSVSIPKVEPLCSSPSSSNDDTSNIDEMMTPVIPFIRAYKVRDPVVMLERCDKVWETLKLLKDVQPVKPLNRPNVLPSNASSKSLYVKYQPVLSNNNDALPNFKLSVKATKKLFQCLTCGKLYAENRRLRYHAERVHGVYIPPKRIRSSTLEFRNVDKAKEKQKDSNTTEREEEKDNDNQVHSRTDEDKSSRKVPFHPIQLSSSKTSDSTIQSQQRKSNISINTSSNDNTSEPPKTDQGKLVSRRELKPNEQPSGLQNSISLTCELCKQTVRNMREHLIDYHKIKSPEFMLKNLSTCTVLENEELDKSVDDYNSNSNNIVQKQCTTHFHKAEKRAFNELDSASRKRQKVCNSNNSKSQIQESLDDKKVQCDICLGSYKRKSFYRHKRIHRIRGETKENLHLSNFKYKKSPLYAKLKKNFNLNDALPENQINQNSSNAFKNKETDKHITQKEDESNSLNGNLNEKNKHICCCGRSFRDPHTLFRHRKKCNRSNTEVQSSTQSSENKTASDAQQNSSDRDSGIGINITIKKNNNSYEIIDKDNGQQSVCQTKKVTASSRFSEVDKQIQQQIKPSESLETSKYSENHSVLRIQVVNEDIDIDIEDDSQTSSCDNIVSSTSKIITDVHKGEMQGKVKIEQNEESKSEDTINMHHLQQKIPSKKKRKKIDGFIAKMAKKYNICVCGRKFYARKALEVHMNKHHLNSKLICGYCKIVCPNVATWNKHQCSINKGKRFIDLPIGLNCPHCSTTLNTYKDFDEHIRVNHYDSIVPYQCYGCERRFHNVKTRKDHFDKEHGLSSCSICGNKCRHTMISRHKAYHFGLGFPCHLCKKTYVSNVSVTRHMLQSHPSQRHTKIADSSSTSVPFPKNSLHRESNAVKTTHSTNTEVNSSTNTDHSIAVT